MGLVFFASPLCIGEQMEASYVGGPVMMTDLEQYQIGDFQNAEWVNSEEFIEHLKLVPQRSPVQTRHLSDLLFSSAAYVCEGADYFAQQQIKDRQQSKISAYIQHLKIQNAESHAYSYPINKEKELMDTIAAGDKKNAQQLLNEILGHIFFSSGGKMEIIRARVLELVVVLSRAALDGGADMQHIFGLNFKYLGEVSALETIEDLSVWLSTLMNRFTESVFNWADIKHVDTIYKAIAFIRENYASKITLEDVSAYVYLSPSYFSKIFKDEMHTSFNSYLNKIRIDNAKRMLVNEDVNIIDISNLVGYEDQSYFSKVFKNVTGVTPGKYRILRGKINSQPL
jgi:AraC-like DNA-binding protein